MKKIRIYVPSGIGDVAWTMTKVPSIKKQNQADIIEMIPQLSAFNRSDDFLYHFDFVNLVQYEEFDIQPSIPYIPISIPNIFNASSLAQENMVDSKGRYRFIESTGNFMGDPSSWILIPNGHISEGKRIEQWYPEYQTDIYIANHFRFRDDEVEEAERFHKSFLDNHPFIVFYMGPLEGNTIAGYNRNGLWSLYNWYQVAYQIHKINRDVRFLITGAKQDWQYANLFIGSLPNLKEKFINACGCTRIGVSFALIQRSNFLLSFPSGIGIFSVYLNHPTSIFFRPEGNSISPDMYISFDEDMSQCWAPVEYINTTYFPVFYSRHSPEYIVNRIINFL